jgi:hypothetical protein
MLTRTSLAATSVCESSYNKWSFKYKYMYQGQDMTKPGKGWAAWAVGRREDGQGGGGERLMIDEDEQEEESHVHPIHGLKPESRAGGDWGIGWG